MWGTTQTSCTPTLTLPLARRLPKANAISAHAWHGRCRRLAPAAAPWGWVLARHQHGVMAASRGAAACCSWHHLDGGMGGVRCPGGCTLLLCSPALCKPHGEVEVPGFELSCRERLPTVILCPEHGASVGRALRRDPTARAPCEESLMVSSGSRGEAWWDTRRTGRGEGSPPRPCVGTAT